LNDQSKDSSLTVSPKTPLLHDLHCDEIIYRITITPDKFDYGAFTKALGQEPLPDTWGDVVCISKAFDYHVHIGWKNEKNQIRLQIGHYTDPPEATAFSAKETLVVAEEAMGFVGKFFKNDNTQAHIHADFDFESGRTSKFPLPLRTTIGACKAEIDGIGFKLSDTPSGVSKAWIVQTKSGLAATLFADRRIEFAKFSVAGDVREFISVIDAVTEAKS
jgi:hypothetical protein